jgi:hypothetical protein
VEEARAAAGVAPVVVPDGPREQVKLSVVKDCAGVEDRPVAVDGAVGDDRFDTDAPDSDGRRDLLPVSGQRGVRS